jgi:hypothetical protein
MPFQHRSAYSSLNPLPELHEEMKRYRQLQQDFIYQYQVHFHNNTAEKIIVVVPSLTLDQEILCKLKGHIFYEERLLCMLLLLQMPNTKIIFITSVPVDQAIVEYYLGLLPTLSRESARSRLYMLSCYDASVESLTEKILARPRLIQRIDHLIADKKIAHMSCFNVTHFERTLATTLGIPVYGCDPDLLHLGSKSGSRTLFKKCGIQVPPGYENLKSEEDIYAALSQLKKGNPLLKKAVLKLEDGFSGDGNAVFTFPEINNINDAEYMIRTAFASHLKIVASDLDVHFYLEKFKDMGGIVEAFIDGNIKTSPSVQCRINPLRETVVISTHDQFLGGEDAQVFLGSHFPANDEYSNEIARIGKIVADKLCDLGALGRFSIDFVSVKENNQWNHYAIEINLRKGGTTHPNLLLQLLTNGKYDTVTGKYITAKGNTRYYFASNNVESVKLKGLTAQDLLDIVQEHELLYNHETQEGILFHLLGALSEYGKLGILCIGSSKERTGEIFEKMAAVLNNECKK